MSQMKVLFSFTLSWCSIFYALSGLPTGQSFSIPCSSSGNRSSISSISSSSRNRNGRRRNVVWNHRHWHQYEHQHQHQQITSTSTSTTGTVFRLFSVPENGHHEEHKKLEEEEEEEKEEEDKRSAKHVNYFNKNADRNVHLRTTSSLSSSSLSSSRRHFSNLFLGGMTSLPLLITPGLAVAADGDGDGDGNGDSNSDSSNTIGKNNSNDDANASPSSPSPSTDKTNSNVTTDKKRTLLRGTVDLQPGVTIPKDLYRVEDKSAYEGASADKGKGEDDESKLLLSKSALYVTARPNNAVDVPRAILDGSNGKAPPVLAARIPNVQQFPLKFELTELDLTMEGNASFSIDVGSDSNGNGNVNGNNDGNVNGNGKYWWEGKDLVVSARFDSDGVAATRDPTDLVGRGLFAVKSNDDVTIQLQGRGFTGKLFTGKSK